MTILLLMWINITIILCQKHDHLLMIYLSQFKNHITSLIVTMLIRFTKFKFCVFQTWKKINQANFYILNRNDNYLRFTSFKRMALKGKMFFFFIISTIDILLEFSNISIFISFRKWKHLYWISVAYSFVVCVIGFKFVW